MKHSTTSTDIPANSDFTSGEIVLNTADRLIWFGDSSNERSTFKISSFNNDSGYTTNTGTVDTSGTPVANDFAKFTDANTIEGRSYSEVKQDLNLEIGTDVQAYDAGLNSIAGLTTAANKMIYTSGSDTYAVTGLTAAGRAILDDADAAAQRTTLGVDAAGTDNSTNVTLVTSSHDYLSLSSQAITLGAIALADDVSGTLPVANGGTNITSFTSGDILYASGSTTLAKLAKGTAGQILAMDSSAGAPEWITGGGDITSVSLTAGTGVDITSVSGASSGDYAATIGVDVSDFLATGSNNYVVTATGTDGLKGEANLTFDGDDLVIASSGKLEFGGASSGQHIYESTDNQLDIAATTELAITAPTVDIDASTEVNISTDLKVGDDLFLTSDASVINMGAGNDFTITHDNDTGGTIAGSPVTITSAEACKWSTSSGALEIESASDIDLDAAGDIELNADGDEIDFKFGGAAGHLKFTNTNSGDIVIRQMINNKDIVFKDNGDSEVMRIDDDDGIQLGGSGAVVSTIQSTNESFADNDTSLMTSAAILDKIGAELPTKFDTVEFTTDTGTGSKASDSSGTTASFVMTGGSGMNVTNSGVNISIAAEDSTASNKGAVIVAGGTNATVTYSSGTATVAVDDAFLKNDANDTTSGTITAGGFTTTGTWTFDTTGGSTQGITQVTKSGETFSDSDAALMTAAAINDRFATSGGGSTDLGKTTATNQITITSSTGNDVVIGEATGSIAGLMSTAHHNIVDAAITDVAGANSLTITELGSVTAGEWAATDIAVAHGGTGRSTLSSGQVLLGNGTSGINSRAIGIADNNIVEIDDADAADNDFAKFTANGLEGRSYSEVKSDLGLEIGTDVMAHAANNATSSSTNTFTNKTFDANASGNSLSNVDLANDMTGTLPVANGGTGATSLTDGGLLLGSGTGAITALGVASNGQIPIGDGSTDPQLATITAGSGISVTNGSGSITIAATGGGGSGNAWSDQVDSDLVPDTNNQYDLGTVSRQFKDAFFDGNVEADTYTGHGDAGVDVGAGVFSFTTAGMPSMQVDLTASVGIVTHAASAPGASDSRVKENITDFTTGLSLIDALKLKTFTYKDGYGPSGTHIGVLTQDIETIDSEYVNVAKEGDETYGDIAGISMKFGNEYRMALIKAVQELSAKNTALEARIAVLEG